MFKALIIDDLKEVSDVLLFLLNANFSNLFERIDVENSFLGGLNALKQNDYDVVFLDIELDNNKTGFELLNELDQDVDFSIVITTAHSHYALEAIKLSAIDFLLKPVDIDELSIAVKKIKNVRLNERDIFAQLKNLREHLDESLKKEEKIILKTHDSIKVIALSDIIRCEAEINYTIFYLKENRKVVVAKSLKEYDDVLSNKGFFRAHKSHLINLDHLLSYEKKDGGYILMSDSSKVPLSIRKKDPFFKVLSSLG